MFTSAYDAAAGALVGIFSGGHASDFEAASAALRCLDDAGGGVYLAVVEPGSRAAPTARPAAILWIRGGAEGPRRSVHPSVGHAVRHAYDERGLDRGVLERLEAEARRGLHARFAVAAE